MPTTNRTTANLLFDLLLSIYLELSAQLMTIECVIRIFSAIHWLGIAMLLIGIYSLWPNGAPETGSIVLYATLIGLGLLMMAPYPIILFIRWSQKSSTNKPE